MHDSSSFVPLQPSHQASDPDALFQQGLRYRKDASGCCCQGHVLQARTYQTGHHCDVCFRPIVRQSEGLECKACEYDVCSNCSAICGAGVDLIKSFSFFHAAATLGHVQAQYTLGYCYQNGEGVEQCDQDAFEWMRLSADQGYSLAQDMLADYYDEGRGVEQNDTEAFKWRYVAAEQGFILAQIAVGVCHCEGKGVAQSHEEAVKWFRLAAEHSYCEAQYLLGSCYVNGNGVDEDDVQAFHWFKLAADQGHPPAQFRVGLCYCNGEGIEMNDFEAFKWFQLAAQNEDSDAAYLLGSCYASGLGVDLDLQQAAMWYRRAADQGVEEAEEAISQLAGIVVVDRQNILQSSIAHFNTVTNKALSSTDFKIKFIREEGIDGGGLFNEWMSLLTKELFCPPLFLPIVEKGCLARFLRLNPMSMSFFQNPNDCCERLRLAGIVLGFSFRRGVPLGVDLTPGFCKLLLGEEACFEDLRIELPHEYQWMSEIKEAMQQAALAADDPAHAADAKLHVAEEEYRRGLHTPSRRRQVWECINGLKEARPDAYGDMLRLFEERCLRHSGRPDDDEVSSFVPLQLSAGGDDFVSGSNFEEYVQNAVQKQLRTNLQEVMCHIYPSFQAVVLGQEDDEDDEDDECYVEIPPEELRARLGDVSAATLLAGFSGIDSSLLLSRACA
jgi:TPR repeat protein